MNYEKVANLKLIWLSFHGDSAMNVPALYILGQKSQVLAHALLAPQSVNLGNVLFTLILHSTTFDRQTHFTVKEVWLFS